MAHAVSRRVHLPTVCYCKPLTVSQHLPASLLLATLYSIPLTSLLTQLVIYYNIMHHRFQGPICPASSQTGSVLF